MNDLINVILAIILAFIVLIISEIIRKKFKLDKKYTRKFIHIAAANYWIYAVWFIQDGLYALVVPLLFMIFNYISYKKNIIKSMEIENKDTLNLGTIFYPIAFIVLIILFWENGLIGNYKYIGTIGILIMGYGDGFSALIGLKYGSKKNHMNKKTLEGSLTVFIVAFIISSIVLKMNTNIPLLSSAIIISGVSMLLEFYTPFGIDNFTLSIGTSLLSYYIVIDYYKTIKVDILLIVVVILTINFFYKRYKNNNKNI